MATSASVQDMPVRGEHLVLDLVNTTFVRGGLRGQLVDVLRTPADLDAWIADHRGPLDLAEPCPAFDGPDGPAALAAFVELREVLRRLLRAAVSGTVPRAADVAAVNSAARACVDWIELPPSGEGPPLRRSSCDDPSTVLRARLARAAVELLTGPDRELLRACPAPGCVLFYLRSHPRRAWCSTGCGTRVRVARHSRRHSTDSR